MVRQFSPSLENILPLFKKIGAAIFYISIEYLSAKLRNLRRLLGVIECDECLEIGRKYEKDQHFFSKINREIKKRMKFLYLPIFPRVRVIGVSRVGMRARDEEEERAGKVPAAGIDLPQSASARSTHLETFQ